MGRRYKERILKNRKNINVLLNVIVAIATVFRIILAGRTPLLLQGDAKYDDFLLVKYADSIYHHQWLGEYCHTTLLKTISAPFLLVINRLLGIDYGFYLIIIYILSVILLVYAFNLFLTNTLWEVCTYLFLLYSPIMFHMENVQKIYRGGFIVSFSMLVIAGVVGGFASCRRDVRIQMLWVMVESISLPIFWFLKEDSIWLMPFVLAGSIVSILYVISKKSVIDRSVLRVIICVIPIIVLLVCKSSYQEKNYRVYGVRTETDRSGTEFSNVISDMLHIENASKGTAWVTREALIKACDASPALNTIRDSLVSVYENRAEDNGDVDGDFVIMAIREAAAKNGIYDQNGEKTELFYSNVHNELTQAFINGKLQYDDRNIYISRVSRGYSYEELKEYYRLRGPSMVRMLLSYEHNETNVRQSSGKKDNLKLMSMYVGDKYVDDNTDDAIIDSYTESVSNINTIVDLYKMSGKTICKLAIIGYVLFLLCNIAALKCDFRYLNWNDKEKWCCFIITGGLLLTCLLLITAIIWFCNFLTDWKVYDYCSAAIPIIQILEAVGGWCLINCSYKIGKEIYDIIH